MNKNHLREQMALLLPADVKERVIIGVDKIVCGVCHSPVVDYCESPNNYEEPKYWEDGKEFGVSIFYLCTGCSVAYAVGDLRGTEKDIYRLQEQIERSGHQKKGAIKMENKIISELEARICALEEELKNYEAQIQYLMGFINGLKLRI